MAATLNVPRKNFIFPDYQDNFDKVHFMKIRAFPSGTNTSEHTIVLFVPGGPQNGSLSWKTVNDYAETSMTKIGATAFGIGDVAAVANFGMQTLGGAAINPKVEVLFRTTQLRQFQFNFMFAPSTQNEAEEMEYIIKTIRYHAAPEIDGESDPRQSYIGVINQAGYLTSGYFMKAPSEFVIQFHRGSSGEENTHLPKIGRSVIERVDVDYTPQGEYSTFSNGYPVSALLTVVFREMRIIGKENINRGY